MNDSMHNIRARIVFVEARFDDKNERSATFVYLTALSGELHLSDIFEPEEKLVLKTPTTLVLLIDETPSEENGGYEVTALLLDWMDAVVTFYEDDIAAAWSAAKSGTWAHFSVSRVCETSDLLQALAALDITLVARETRFLA